MGDAPSLIDFTALQKRGLIKKKEISKFAAHVNKEGFVDLSAIGQDKINQLANSQQQGLSQTSSPSLFNATASTQSSSSQSTPSFTSFWDQLPGQTPTQSTPAPVSSTAESSYYGSDSSSSSLSSSDNIETLKVKLQDMEYKLSRLTETLDIITNKLANFENKVS
jgi:hypothetical protein